MNLKKSFLEYCERNSFEINQSQLVIIDRLKDYHKDRIRIYFELKGLGSIGRPKENYLRRRSL